MIVIINLLLLSLEKRFEGIYPEKFAYKSIYRCLEKLFSYQCIVDLFIFLERKNMFVKTNIFFVSFFCKYLHAKTVEKH